MADASPPVRESPTHNKRTRASSTSSSTSSEQAPPLDLNDAPPLDLSDAPPPATDAGMAMASSRYLDTEQAPEYQVRIIIVLVKD